MHEPSTRTKYTYDALGRLFTSTTPEGGTTCFGTKSGGSCAANTGYDNFNNLLYRTDARGVVTSYGYDGLNRPTSVGYNVTGTNVPATASVGFTYGASGCSTAHGAGCVGQLITMTDGVGSENYSYNALEQFTQLQKIISGTTYITSYAYNIAGELTQITYPSGRVIQQSVDAIGRLCEIAPSSPTGCGSASNPYATGYSYNVAGQLTGFKYGNNIYASLGYSSDGRLQLKCLDYSTTNRGQSCTHDSTTKFGMTYSYGSAPNNNGLITGITDSVDNGRSVTYTYDPLSRLASAQTTGSTNYPQWGLSWGYDRYGNRLNQTLTAGSGYQGSVQVTASSNRVNCIGGSGQSCTGGVVPTYDASGNMTNDGSNTVAFDAENHAVSATNASASGSYTYDGNGLRVKKVSSSTTTVYLFSGSKVIAEYENGAGPAGPAREYIYGGGTLLAKIDSSGTKYYHQDQLSNRLVTDSAGNTVEQMGHYPFGDPWYNVSNDKLYFTTYERDAESSNDYAMARFYRWLLGRFLSLDPLSGSISDPQSLNRYIYVENNPISFADPSGMDECLTGDYGACSGGSGDPSSSNSGIQPICDASGFCAFRVTTNESQGNLPDNGPMYYTPPSQGGGDLIGAGQFGQGPIGGGGCTGPLATGCLVNQAFKRALDLLKNEDCASFIAGISLVDPSGLLSALIAGNTPYGTVQVSNIEPLNGVPAIATTVPGPSTTQNLGLPGQVLNVTTGSATITINSNPSSPFNGGFPAGADFGVNQTTRNALTLLHELGHAINDISGGQNSGIMFDGNRVPGGILVSAANSQATSQHCLP